MRRRWVQFLSLPVFLTAVGATLVAAPQAAQAATSYSITTPFDVLGVGPRMVFSTVNEIAGPAEKLTITNTGTDTLSVTSLTISGTNASFFKLATGQPTAFTVAPGAAANVQLIYRPHCCKVHTASLSIDGIGATVPLA